MVQMVFFCEPWPFSVKANIRWSQCPLKGACGGGVFVWSTKSSELENKINTDTPRNRHSPGLKNTGNNKIFRGGGNSNIFSCFTPDFVGFHDPIWRAHIFQTGLVQPPTSIAYPCFCQNLTSCLIWWWNLQQKSHVVMWKRKQSSEPNHLWSPAVKLSRTLNGLHLKSHFCGTNKTLVDQWFRWLGLNNGYGYWIFVAGV